MRKREELLVLTIELVCQHCKTLVLELIDCCRERKLECLPGIANIRLESGHLLFGRNTVRFEGLAGSRAKLYEFVNQVVGRDLVDTRHIGLGRFVSNLRRRITVGAEYPGTRRHNDRPGARQDTQSIGMQGARTTETDEREIARVVTLLDRHESQRTQHRFVNDLDDALSRGHQLDTHGVGQRLHRFFCCVTIDGHCTAELHVRREITENDVRIAYSRNFAALHVGSRARVRACRVWSHTQGFR